MLLSMSLSIVEPRIMEAKGAEFVSGEGIEFVDGTNFEFVNDEDNN